MPHPSSPGPRRQPGRRRCANLPARLPQPGAGIYRSSRYATKPVSHPRHTLGPPALQVPSSDHESGPPATDDPSAPSEPSGEVFPRFVIAILSPSPGEAIRANNGTVPLSLSLNPGLAPGERLRLQLDGQTLMTTETPAAVLTRLARGEHTLLIKRLDAGGRTLAAAERTFYVLRTALGRRPKDTICTHLVHYILGAGHRAPPEIEEKRTFWAQARA